MLQKSYDTGATTMQTPAALAYSPLEGIEARYLSQCKQHPIYIYSGSFR